MKTKTLALNTELRPLLEAIADQKGAPLWVELIPSGLDVIGRDGRTWVNNSPQSVVDAFRSNGADLPIDIEHSTELKAPNGEPAPAMAWIKALKVREGGAIWGLVEWNCEGSWLVESKQYRYLSPVFTFDKESGRILRLLSAGLTNNPNLHLTALNQRQHSQPNNQGEQQMALALAIATALGLSADATEEQGVAAINRLNSDKQTALNSAQNPSIEKFVPRADHDAALNRAEAAETKLKEHEQTALNQEIETELSNALKVGVITPSTIDYHRACCQQKGGLDRFKEFAKSAPEIGGDSGLDSKQPKATNGTLSDEEKAACRAMGMDEDEYKQAKEAK